MMLDDAQPHRPTFKEIGYMLLQPDVGVFVGSSAFAIGELLRADSALWILLVCYSLVFTAFDAVLYKRVLRQANGEPRLAYRIVQTTLQFAMLISLCAHTWWSPVLFYFLHHMGVFDALYYVLTEEVQWAWDYQGEWYWLSWTLPAKIGITMNYKRLLASSSIAIVSVCVILYLA